MVFAAVSVGRGKLLEDPLPLTGIALADSGTVDDHAVGVDGYLGGLTCHIEVTNHLAARRRHFSRIPTPFLVRLEHVQRFVEPDCVEVNRVLERGIDGA